MSNAKRTGRLSRSEISFIDENLDAMSDDEIAKAIERSPDAVAQRRANRPQRETNTKMNDFVAQLHEKHFWETVQRSLLKEELPVFENSWASLYAQFVHQGVTATDEIMMKDVIIDDILLHRALEEKRKIIEEIQDQENEMDRIKLIPMANRTQAEVDSAVNAHRTVVQLRGAQEAYTKEINDIKKTKDGKFKDLKATRQERLKVVEESGKNIFALIKHLDERKQRESEGRMTGLVYEAARIKQKELEEYTTFADKEVDRPWMTPESELIHEQKEIDTRAETEVDNKTEE